MKASISAALAITLAGAISAESATAASEMPERAVKLMQQDGWGILRSKTKCMAYQASPSEKATVSIVVGTDDVSTLWVRSGTQELDAQDRVDIDGREIFARENATSEFDFTDGMADMLSDGHVLTIRKATGETATLPVDGISTVLRLLEVCTGLSTNDGRFDAFPEVPPVLRPRSPMIPEPDLTGPLPPNREIKAIRPDLWVQYTDYKSEFLREGKDGVVQFKLDVGPMGTVQACEVTKSSGHADLDDFTCQLLMKRARFDPSTDAASEPISGSYTNRVHWAIP